MGAPTPAAEAVSGVPPKGRSLVGRSGKRGGRGGACGPMARAAWVLLPLSLALHLLLLLRALPLRLRHYPHLLATSGDALGTFFDGPLARGTGTPNGTAQGQEQGQGQGGALGGALSSVVGGRDGTGGGGISDGSSSEKGLGAGEGDQGSNAFPAEVQRKAQELLQTWSETYGLSQGPGAPLLPPATIDLHWGNTSQVPWAPHLEECSAVEERRRQLETQRDGAGGMYPAWACSLPGQEPAFCTQPHTPWVHGPDEDNLPLTRVAQRDIWVNQFPPNCSDPSLRFLVVQWAEAGEGVASQVHSMAAALALALASKRVLVPVNFPQADNQHCTRLGRKGSLKCYFVGATGCATEALSLWKQEGLQLSPNPNAGQSSNSARLLALRAEDVSDMHTAAAADSWIPVWPKSFPLHLLGNTAWPLGGSAAKALWWRSQAARFLLRWPSPYLCHRMNGLRHAAYGRHVALQVALSATRQQEIIKGSFGGIEKRETELLTQPQPANGIQSERTDAWRFRDEPYAPRPLALVHVPPPHLRMKLRGAPSTLRAYVWRAYRLRRLVPSLSHIWLASPDKAEAAEPSRSWLQRVASWFGSLSTGDEALEAPQEDVREATLRYRDWTFLGIQGKGTGKDGSAESGGEGAVGGDLGESLSNLLISSQADFFILSFGSKWDDLINELRLTGGHARAALS